MANWLWQSKLRYFCIIVSTSENCNYNLFPIDFSFPTTQLDKQNNLFSVVHFREYSCVNVGTARVSKKLITLANRCTEEISYPWMPKIYNEFYKSVERSFCLTLALFIVVVWDEFTLSAARWTPVEIEGIDVILHFLSTTIHKNIVSESCIHILLSASGIVFVCVHLNVSFTAISGTTNIL